MIESPSCLPSGTVTKKYKSLRPKKRRVYRQSGGTCSLLVNFILDLRLEDGSADYHIPQGMKFSVSCILTPPSFLNLHRSFTLGRVCQSFNLAEKIVRLWRLSRVVSQRMRNWKDVKSLWGSSSGIYTSTYTTTYILLTSAT